MGGGNVVHLRRPSSCPTWSAFFYVCTVSISQQVEEGDGSIAACGLPTPSNGLDRILDISERRCGVLGPDTLGRAVHRRSGATVSRSALGPIAAPGLIKSYHPRGTISVALATKSLSGCALRLRGQAASHTSRFRGADHDRLVVKKPT